MSRPIEIIGESGIGSPECPKDSTLPEHEYISPLKASRRSKTQSRLDDLYGSSAPKIQAVPALLQKCRMIRQDAYAMFASRNVLVFDATNHNYQRTMQWLVSANANVLHPIKEMIVLGQARCGSQGENSPCPQGGHYFAAHVVFLAMEQAVEYREAHSTDTCGGHNVGATTKIRELVSIVEDFVQRKEDMSETQYKAELIAMMRKMHSREEMYSLGVVLCIMVPAVVFNIVSPTVMNHKGTGQAH
ncbi:hypothetical protein LTR27_008046 [Elasticomyces elasticus]|nr:hypothetical protein LTR27_008046 [Elasticomyces elasticus]